MHSNWTILTTTMTIDLALAVKIGGILFTGLWSLLAAFATFVYSNQKTMFNDLKVSLHEMSVNLAVAKEKNADDRVFLYGEIASLKARVASVEALSRKTDSIHDAVHS